MPTFRGDPDAMIADLAGRPGVASIAVAGVSLPTAVAPAPTVPRKGGGRKRPGVRTDAPARLIIEVVVPIRVVSEANVHGKLRNEIGRKREVKAAVTERLPRLDGPFPLPATVTLTRQGVKELDDDNARRAMKAVRDRVAFWMGVDDADKRVTWRYKQRAAWTPHVTVRIEHKGRT